MTIRWSAMTTSVLALALLLAVPGAGAAGADLLDTTKFKEKAPDTYKAKFETTKGDFVVEVTRAWSPRGADRFYNLVKGGYYDGVKVFRVVPGFVVQFGIHGDPKVNAVWKNARIGDDPVKEGNLRGMVTFAMGGANSRTTQIFINLQDNRGLDNQGFSPFGRVAEGMKVVEDFFSGYKEDITSQQGAIFAQGNAFLDANYPKLDSITKATIVP